MESEGFKKLKRTVGDFLEKKKVIDETTDDLLNQSAATMKTDPVRGACLFALAAGRGKHLDHKVKLALGCYAAFHNQERPLTKVDVNAFCNTPPPKLRRVIRDILYGMQVKGYF